MPLLWEYMNKKRRPPMFSLVDGFGGDIALWDDDLQLLHFTAVIIA
jgi:hypothetical protein